MANIDTLLKQLREQFARGNDKYVFYPGVDESKLILTEQAMGVEFPWSYRTFLMEVNGGMILANHPSYYTDMLDWEPDGPKESSYYFLSLEEIIDKHQEVKDDNTMYSHDYGDICPIIPIATTPDHGIIAVINQKGIEKESPVFHIGDLDDMNTYLEIFDSFSDYFESYLKNNGVPTFTKDERNRFMSLYLYDNRTALAVSISESPEERIKRLTAAVELYPTSAYCYWERGVAYEEEGSRQLALQDFNKAIALDPEDAYYRNCRADLLYEYGSPRKALIDFDVAVKFKPDDLFFRNGRAKALLKLNRLQDALSDCNYILERDENDTLALTTRYYVYGALGDYVRMEEDSRRLDELFDGQ